MDVRQAGRGGDLADGLPWQADGEDGAQLACMTQPQNLLQLKSNILHG
jgi:hypothetical protein